MSRDVRALQFFFVFLAVLFLVALTLGVSLASSPAERWHLALFSPVPALFLLCAHWLGRCAPLQVLFTPRRHIHGMDKSQLFLLSAKLFALRASLFALVSVSDFIVRHWTVGLMLGSLSILYGCLAFVQYALSRKAKDGAA